MKKLNFEISPIFKQTNPIWTEFMHIECACDEKLNYHPDDMDKQRMMLNYKADWQENRYKFAFAAYRANRIIGFTRGYLGSEPGETYIAGLYVLPRYHKIGIGTKLLKMAERTSSIVADRVGLIALPNAVDFYLLKNDYEQREGSTKKDLSPFITGVVPVFQWMTRKINCKFNVEVDNVLLRANKNQPMFIYLNEFGEVDGVAVHTKDGKNKFWVKRGQDLCRYELSWALNRVR